MSTRSDETPPADAGQLGRGVRRLPPGPLRLKVDSPRHSYCAMPLGWLDWSRWFTDGSGGRLYLHVYGPDDSIQRVYCRKTETPRLQFMDGQLWWLVDRAPNVRAKLPDAAQLAWTERDNDARRSGST